MSARRTLVSVAIVAQLLVMVGLVVYRHTGAPSETGTPTDTPSDTPTDTPTDTPSDTPTDAASDTPTETETDTATDIATDTATDTATETETETSAETETDAAVEAPSPPPAAPPALLGRPLRVVTTRWGVAAPMLLAAGGLHTEDGSLLARAGLRQELSVLARDADVEEALARGGEQGRGADVAIVPLSRWLAIYERLGALATEAFLVAAWSRGADSLFVADSVDLAQPLPAALSLAGERGAPATLAALVLLDEMGARAEATRVVPIDAPAPFAASPRRGADAELAARGRIPWLGTADAPRLAPWVVIAPRAFVRAHQPALQAWSRVWLEGRAQLVRDLPGAARAIATLPDAPSLVELLAELDQLESVGLDGQTELLGLRPGPAPTLELLFTRGWAIYRALGWLPSPRPEPAPIATGAVAAIARGTPPDATPPIPYRATRTRRVLASFPLATPRDARDAATADAFVARIAFVAGVAPRSGLVVTVPRAQLAFARALVARTVAEHAVDPARVELEAGSAARLTLLAPP